MPKNEPLRTCLELSSLHSILSYPSGKSFPQTLLVYVATLGIIELSRAHRSRVVRERAQH